MKTALEMEKEILKMTMKIHAEYPELSKYLKEMPVTISTQDNGTVNFESLKDYHDSLVELISSYSKTHGTKK